MNKSSEKLPNKNELFEIIKIALNRKDLIGCICENVNHFLNKNINLSVIVIF